MAASARHGHEVSFTSTSPKGLNIPRLFPRLWRAALSTTLRLHHWSHC